jgi:hypothetical protein
VTASGEGTTSGATADTDGLGADVLANDSGGEDPQVDVEITDQDGSTTGVTVTVPVGGVTVP